MHTEPLLVSKSNLDEKISIRLALSQFEKSYNDRRASALQTVCKETISDLPTTTNKRVKISIKKITLDGDSASVLCKVRISDNDFIYSDTSTYIQMKKNSDWKVMEMEPFNKLFTTHQSGALSSDTKKSDIVGTSSSPSYQDVEITLSDRTYIRVPHYSSVYDVGYSLTQSYLDLKLFAPGTRIDAAAYYNTSDNSMTIFALDSAWHRIIYVKRYSDGSYSSIKAYGNNVNHVVHFGNPVAIDVNYAGEIFVVDNGYRKIFKLQYTSSTNTITCSSNASFIDQSYLSYPVDIDYDESVSGHEYMVIADLGRHSILQFDTDGSLIDEYTTYRVDGGVSASINKPIRLCAKGIYLCYIEGEDNMIIVGYMLDGYGIVDSFSSWGMPSKLSSAYNPVDIGFGWNGQGLPRLIVADRKNNMIPLLSR